MRSRFLWLFLIGLGIALLLLLAGHDGDLPAGLMKEDLPGLILKIAFLVFVGGAVLVIFRESFTKALQAALLWVVVALLLTVGYTYRFELRSVYDRVMAELMPGRAFSKGRVVEVARGRAGDFPVSAHINGVKIPMTLDTGATAVVLTQEAAKAAGLPLEVLNYSVTVDTANGRTRAAAVTLDRLGIGNVIEKGVPALIAQPGQLRTNLLGLSFLNRLESWEVRGDRLILRGYP